MLLSEHKKLIDALSLKTEGGAIKWVKGDARLSFSSLVDGNKILIEKYYTITDGVSASCLNLSIFNKQNQLCEELLLCKAIQQEKPDYDLLDGLYKLIELKFSDELTKSKIPLISSITESVQQL